MEVDQDIIYGYCCNFCNKLGKYLFGNYKMCETCNWGICNNCL